MAVACRQGWFMLAHVTTRERDLAGKDGCTELFSAICWTNMLYIVHFLPTIVSG
jgi:hypothetical protein